MKISKKIMVLSLATCLTLSPLMVSANNEKEVSEIAPISAEVKNTEKKIMIDYTKYEGKITEINKKDDSISILVKDNEEEAQNGEVLHINEKVIILNDKTKEFMGMEELKDGMKITRYTHKDTPVAMSLPPQLIPDIIVVNESEDTGFINVSKFNEELVNIDNTLKILISEETVIVDGSGEKVAKEDLKNRDLIVFYTTSTKSIPAQAKAEKIIAMDGKKVEEEVNEIKVLDKIVINEKEISLDKSLYENKNGVTMIPLRQISEALGYKVTWNNELRAAELTKGAQWSSVKVGEDNYNFAKMIVKLGVAPEVRDSVTFVPLTFLEEVLKINVSITEKGIVNIAE